MITNQTWEFRTSVVGGYSNLQSNFIVSKKKMKFKRRGADPLTRMGYNSMRGSGGGRDRAGVRKPPPPWDLSEMGSGVDIWWIGEGVQRLLLSYSYIFFFWLAPIASIILNGNIWNIQIISKFKGLPRHTHYPWLSWKCNFHVYFI